MGTAPEELRQEIADTRADLSTTLDAIGDRVSPGRMIERRKNRMTESVQSLRDQVMGTAHHAGDSVTGVPGQVREHTRGAPILAGAIAFGVGFLIASAVPASSAEEQLGSTLLDKAEPLKEELVDAGKAVAQHLSEPAKESVASVKEAAAQSAQTVADQAKGAVMDTKEQASQRVDEVRSQ